MSQPRLRLLPAFLLILAGGLSPSIAAAIGLGPAEVRSGLGQPLNMLVPVAGDDAADLSAECVRVVRPSGTLDGVAPVTSAVADIVRRAETTAIRVRTMSPVAEPAVQLTVEAGCLAPVRREFVLLLDPVELPQGPAPAGAPLDFGAAEVTSTLGEPLAMRVPLIGRDAAELPAECVKVLSVVSDGAEGPVAALGGASLTRSGGRVAIRVTTVQSLIEPSVRVGLEAGCERPIRRDFALLLQAPGAATVAGTAATASGRSGSGEVGAVAATAATAPAAAPTAAARPAARPAAPARATAREPRAAPRRPAPPPRVARDRLRLAPPEAAVPPPSPSPLAVPSPSPAAEPAAPVATGSVPPAGDSAVVDANTRRIEQLEGELQKLRSELVAAAALNKELLEAQKRSAAGGSAARELEAARDSARVAWAVVVAVILMAGGALVLWRQRRPAAPEKTAWYETAMSAVTEMGRPRGRRDAGADKVAAAAAAAAAQLPPEIAEDFAHSSPSRPPSHSDTIQVTELRDAQQLLNELEVIRESRGASRDAAHAAGKFLRLDLDLSSPRAAAEAELARSAPTDDGRRTPRSRELTSTVLVAPPSTQQTGVPESTQFVDRAEDTAGPSTRTKLMVDMDLDRMTGPDARSSGLSTGSSQAQTRPIDFDLQLPTSPSALSPAAQGLVKPAGPRAVGPSATAPAPAAGGGEGDYEGPQSLLSPPTRIGGGGEAGPHTTTILTRGGEAREPGSEDAPSSLLSPPTQIDERLDSGGDDWTTRVDATGSEVEPDEDGGPATLLPSDVVESTPDTRIDPQTTPHERTHLAVDHELGEPTQPFPPPRRDPKR